MFFYKEGTGTPRFFLLQHLKRSQTAGFQLSGISEMPVSDIRNIIPLGGAEPGLRLVGQRYQHRVRLNVKPRFDRLSDLSRQLYINSFIYQTSKYRLAGKGRPAESVHLTQTHMPHMGSLCPPVG